MKQRAGIEDFIRATQQRNAALLTQLPQSADKLITRPLPPAYKLPTQMTALAKG